MAFLGFSTNKCDDLKAEHQNKAVSYFLPLDKSFEDDSQFYTDTFNGHAIKQEPLSPSYYEAPMHEISENYTNEQTASRHILPEQTIIVSCHESTVTQEHTSPAQKRICQLHVRKSMSTNDLHTLGQFLQCFDSNIEETKPYHSSSSKINRQDDTAQTFFVAMAEQICHSRRDNQSKQFHTESKQDQNMFDIVTYREETQHVQSNVPLSPALICKNRNHPITAILPRELEEKEIYEIRNSKIKANPVPRSFTGFASSMIAEDVQRKTSTVQVPFKLTEIEKEPQSGDEFVFQANTAPINILGSPQPLQKGLIHTNEPNIPDLHKAEVRSGECSQKQLDHQEHTDDTKVFGYKYDRAGRAESGKVGIGHSRIPFVGPKTVRPKQVPFSFEKRNEDAKHKKNEKIKKIIEEEKKLHEFKAQPIPNVIKKKLATSKNRSHDETNADKENKSEKIPEKIFEAKPATVLRRAPFEPVRQMRYTRPRPFNLSSERQAAAREIFRQYLKEKEEVLARCQEQADERHRAEDKREVARYRSQLVHHAQPVRHYKPMQVQPSNLPLTVAQSPCSSHRSGTKK